MIIIVGANSHLVENLVSKISERTVVLGRTAPKYINLYKNVEFVETNYEDTPNLIEICNKNADIKVIFAGIGVQPNLLLNVDDLEVSKALSTNIGYTIRFSREILRLMIVNNFGRFIFIGSKESSRGAPGSGLYTVVKSAHIGLSRTLSVEYARFGITSNVLQLGYLSDGYSTQLPSKEIINLKSRIPTSEDLDYESITNVIMAIFSSPSVNGAVIDIDQAVR